MNVMRDSFRATGRHIITFAETICILKFVPFVNMTVFGFIRSVENQDSFGQIKSAGTVQGPAGVRERTPFCEFDAISIDNSCDCHNSCHNRASDRFFLKKE
jgi:hypothetical protein